MPFPEETPKSPEHFLNQEPASFSRQILELWGKANDHTAFRYETTNAANPKERVKKEITPEGKTTITFPENPTLSDTLYASRLIDEACDKHTPLSIFANQLKDSAVLMAQNKAFKDKKFDHIIEDFYKLGASLITQEEQNMSRAEIQKLSIEPPKGVHPEIYKDNLFLFLLGKDTVLSKPENDERLLTDPQHTFYNTLYKKWRIKHDITADTEDERGIFDYTLLKNKALLTSFLARHVKPSYEHGRGKRALQELTEIKITEELDKSISQHGRKLLEKELLNPPNFKEIENKLQAIVRNVLGERVGATPLFETARVLLERLRAQDKNITFHKEISALWDLVQAYQYDITHMPSKMIEKREFECTLRSFVLGQLYEKYLGDKAVVLGDEESDHVRLIVLERETMNTRSPKAYFVDPTYKKIDNPDWWHRAIQVIYDHSFVDKIINACDEHPDSIHLNMALQNASRYGFIKKYHGIGNYKDMTEAAVWNNLGVSSQGEDEQRMCYIKALQLDPNHVSAWLGLGALQKSNEEQRRYYEKALDLDPHYAPAWNNLGNVTEDKEQKRRFLEIALEIDPSDPVPLFNLANSFKNCAKREEFAPYSIENIIDIWHNFLDHQEEAPSEFITKENIEFAHSEIQRLIELLDKKP